MNHIHPLFAGALNDFSRTPCILSQQLARHEREEDAEEAYVEFMEARVDELMEDGNAFDPYSADLYEEAMGELTPIQWAAIAACLRDKDYDNVGRMINDHLVDYCARNARAAIEREDKEMELGL
jgi:hypothetical protein